MNLAKMTRFIGEIGSRSQEISVEFGRPKPYINNMLLANPTLEALLPVAKKLGKDEKFCYYYTREELEKKPRQILIDLAKKMHRGELK
jgi:hypothetical protein